MTSSIEQFALGLNRDSLSKAEDLKKRVLFTLLALVVYRLGTYIPLPGINPDVISEFIQKNAGGFFGMLDMFSGGAIGRMTIFSLMIMPYISSSIIMQLMTTVSPHLEALKKEGEVGRRKINQYTRYGTVLLAAFQSYGISIGLQKMTAVAGPAVLNPGFLFTITTVVTLTGGTLFIMWLGEQITSRGIGNGISLIIYSGIVANLPSSVVRTIELGRKGALSFLVILFILTLVAFVIWYVVFMERAQRRILIQYPKKQVQQGMPAATQTSHLPLKLNSAGVIPPIFASSLLMLPATVAGFSATLSPDTILGKISIYLNHGTPLYMIMFVAMIIGFSFFYTAIVVNPQETAENLRKVNAYIPGIRPGASTANYIDHILTRLTAVGALYLSSVCILPELILAKVGSLPFYLGGTSILIVVSVTIDTIAQVQSHLIAHQYSGLVKRARGKGLIK